MVNQIHQFNYFLEPLGDIGGSIATGASFAIIFEGLQLVSNLVSKYEELQKAIKKASEAINSSLFIYGTQNPDLSNAIQSDLNYKLKDKDLSSKLAVSFIDDINKSISGLENGGQLVNFNYITLLEDIFKSINKNNITEHEFKETFDTEKNILNNLKEVQNRIRREAKQNKYSEQYTNQLLSKYEENILNDSKNRQFFNLKPGQRINVSNPNETPYNILQSSVNQTIGNVNISDVNKQFPTNPNDAKEQIDLGKITGIKLNNNYTQLPFNVSDSKIPGSYQEPINKSVNSHIPKPKYEYEEAIINITDILNKVEINNVNKSTTINQIKDHITNIMLGVIRDTQIIAKF